LLNALLAESRGARELAQGKPHVALERLRRAHDEWRQLEAPYEAARVRVLISQACQMLGDEEAAVLELNAARSAFAQLRAHPDVARVDRLARRVVAGTEHGLTRRAKSKYSATSLPADRARLLPESWR